MRIFNRRQFGVHLASAGVAGALPLGPAFAAEPPPETTTIRLRKSPALCFAPSYVVTEFLRAEGFDDVQHLDVRGTNKSWDVMEAGGLDFLMNFAGAVVAALDNGRAMTALGGLHVGCYELFAHEPIRSVSDLKGRRVGIYSFDTAAHVYISMMAHYVGLDPKRDIEWVTGGPKAMEMFAAGETEAFLGFPPEPQILRARGFDRVVLNTGLDRPWSQYFCCVVYGARDWVQAYPVATKRFLRALYKAAAYCTAQPESAAKQMVADGFADNYEYALETIREIPYDLWHDYDAEDTMRFYALRMQAAGMLKTQPSKLLAEGTDWRFLNELKREMKG